LKADQHSREALQFLRIRGAIGPNRLQWFDQLIARPMLSGVLILIQPIA
jgi:hypothetical protein